MQDFNELFWDASVEELQRGYVYDRSTEEFTCLICGKGFTKGVIYPHGDVLCDAERFVRLHIEEAHESAFGFLVNLDKKLTGLTDLQKKLLSLFYEGRNDADIAKALDSGSTSTIRNHRFNLREKEKQAKILLAIMGLLENKTTKKQKFINVPKTATMLDDRYVITEEENEETLKAYFKDGPDGVLSKFPLKQKKKVIVLRHILKRFEAGREYTEKEVDGVLEGVYADYVTLRRYLIDYGFLDRRIDGSAYWVKA